MADAWASVVAQFRLDGKTALVTGGSQGLGRVIAETYAAAGARVIIVSRKLEACEAAAREIKELTSVATFAYAADVGKADDVAALYARTAKEVGEVDIVANSAGLNIRGPIAELSESDWDAVLDVNLKAPFLIARQYGPAMAERG